MLFGQGTANTDAQAEENRAESSHLSGSRKFWVPRCDYDRSMLMKISMEYYFNHNYHISIKVARTIRESRTLNKYSAFYFFAMFTLF